MKSVPSNKSRTERYSYQTEKLANQARSRAFVRLARRYPGVFRALETEERARLGLGPRSVDGRRDRWVPEQYEATS